MHYNTAAVLLKQIEKFGRPGGPCGQASAMVNWYEQIPLLTD